MAAFSGATGHEIVAQSDADGEYVYYLRRA